MPTRHSVTVGSARFSLLTPHLLRLQYAPFDDRRSMRVYSRPNAIPFEDVRQTDGGTELSSDHFTITYRAGEPFTPETLRVEWAAGGLSGVWDPSVKDAANLGGTFFSMDNINQDLVARGVHPAGLDEDLIEAELLYNPWKLLTVLQDDLRQTQGGRYPLIRPMTGRTARHHWDELSEEGRQVFEKRLRYPAGVLSRAGYFVLNDSRSARLDPETDWQAGPPPPGAQDWYFFAYGHDYARALEDFVTLCGRIPLIPRWAFGYWYSYWADVGDEEQRARVEKHNELDLPLDVYVMDMQWHYPSHWCGFEWNPVLFPEPRAALDWLHEQGVRVTLNLHLDGAPWDTRCLPEIGQALGQDFSAQIEAYAVPDAGTPTNQVTGTHNDLWPFDLGKPDEARAVFDHLIGPLYEDGTDFLWLDGQNGDTPGMNNQLWTNHVFYRDLAERRPDERPLIFSRYGGLGAHRYPVGFAGDTVADWGTLEHEVEFTARAGNVGQVYWSHDLGGHMFGFEVPQTGMPMDPELYIRWVQFGMLSPIARVHSTYGNVREPWVYGPVFVDAFREITHLRMSLQPYFYHLGAEAYQRGLPICRPLYLHYPEDDAAYTRLDEYLLGDRLLIAPIVESGGLREVYLPAGHWWAWLPKGTHAGGGEPLFAGSRTLTTHVALSQIPLYSRAGSILPRQAPTPRSPQPVPDELLIDLFPNAPGTTTSDSLALYEDDGRTMDYRTGGFSRLPLHYTAGDDTLRLRAEPITGGYKGMPETRRFTVRVRFAQQPRGVALDGAALDADAWTWDADTALLTISLGARPVREGWTLEVMQ